jgi:hypothetical protein
MPNTMTTTDRSKADRSATDGCQAHPPDALSATQRLAVRALLEGSSITGAARQANVTRETVAAWRRRDPGFQAALEEGSDALRESFTDRGPGLVEMALNTLVDVMLEAPDSRSRVKAAEVIVKLFPKQLTEWIQRLREREFREAGRSALRGHTQF